VWDFDTLSIMGLGWVRGSQRSLGVCVREREGERERERERERTVGLGHVQEAVRTPAFLVRGPAA
jgi:hypothetical protein